MVHPRPIICSSLEFFTRRRIYYAYIYSSVYGIWNTHVRGRQEEGYTPLDNYMTSVLC